VNWLAPRAFDVPRIVLDAKQLTQATDWQATTSLSDGITLTTEWLRSSDI